MDGGVRSMTRCKGEIVTVGEARDRETLRAATEKHFASLPLLGKEKVFLKKEPGKLVQQRTGLARRG